MYFAKGGGRVPSALYPEVLDRRCEQYIRDVSLVLEYGNSAKMVGLNRLGWRNAHSNSSPRMRHVDQAKRTTFATFEHVYGME